MSQMLVLLLACLGACSVYSGHANGDGAMFLKHGRKQVRKLKKVGSSSLLGLVTARAEARYAKTNVCFGNEDEHLRLWGDRKDELLSSMATQLSLGRTFLRNAQKSQGNFHYQYDFLTKENTDDDNSVRQAGTLWSVALFLLNEHLDGQAGDAASFLQTGKKKAGGRMKQRLLRTRQRQGRRHVGSSDQDSSDTLENVMYNGLQYFRSRAEVLEDGRRIVKYPGERTHGAKLGSLALLALSYIEVLRIDLGSSSDDSPQAQDSAASSTPQLVFLEDASLGTQQLGRELSGLVKTLLGALDDDHRFRKYVDWEDGDMSDGTSPYYEGEALLALIKAAKYIPESVCDSCGEQLWPQILQAAESGYAGNVEPGLTDNGEDDEDAQKRLRGYYQWSSMAWHELLTAKPTLASLGLELPGDFAERLISYGMWMANSNDPDDAHHNKGYAYEGLIPSYLAAKQRSHTSEEAKKVADTIGCELSKGLDLLATFQVGNPKAGHLAQEAVGDDGEVEDNRAKGGCLGKSTKPASLRIDTTQHQMHAVMMGTQLLSNQDFL